MSASPTREQLLEAMVEAMEIADRVHEYEGLDLIRFYAAVGLRVLIDALESHVIEFDDHGWFIEHSFGCRLDGMRVCPINDLARDLDGPPAGGVGRYSVSVVDGALALVAVEEVP